METPFQPNILEDPAFGYQKVDEVDSLSTNNIDEMDRENEETEKDDARSTASSDDVPQLNSELQAGYKILCDLMAESKKATNWPFMESIEVSAPELYHDYKQHIDKPMWLKLMRKKFEGHTYTTITDFVSDFRLMLENCYRYNGPDHYISKRGQKLEIMLEQKLALLPRDLREKTSIEATSGGVKTDDSNSGIVGLRRRPKAVVPHDSTVLLNQLREAEQQKVREYRKQQMLDRRAEKEALVQEIHEWEDKVLFTGQTKEYLKAMWELPQIGLFLFLCQEPLNIGEVMQFELERSFLMPRESATMQLVMTSLLSTPFQRLKLSKKTLMSYNVWEQKLQVKVQQWYKVYTDSGFNSSESCFKLGFEEEFFEVVGHKNPLEKKKYHELGFCKKVWIMKGLCDYCLNTQDYLREAIENQPFHDQREYLLGTDGQGQRYIHFPQFCGADVRIYRQAPFKYPKLEIKPDPFDNKRKFPLVYKPPPRKKMKLTKTKKASEPVNSPNASPLRQRPSRLRQTVKAVVPLQLGADSSSDSESSESDRDETQEEEEEDEEEEGSVDIPSRHKKDRASAKDGNCSDENDLTDNKEEDRLSDATIPYCDRSDGNSSSSSRDCSRESSPYLTPADLGLRRSARLDKYSDTSRDASPLIFDSDFGLRRSSRNRARLKNIPPSRAARNITNMLMDENSTASSSSAFCGESSLSGLWKDRMMASENSRSSDYGEESIDCDMYNKLFSYSKQEGQADCNKSEDIVHRNSNRSKLSKGHMNGSVDTNDESEQMDEGEESREKCSKLRNGDGAENDSSNKSQSESDKGLGARNSEVEKMDTPGNDAEREICQNVTGTVGEGDETLNDDLIPKDGVQDMGEKENYDIETQNCKDKKISASYAITDGDNRQKEELTDIQAGDKSDIKKECKKEVISDGDVGNDTHSCLNGFISTSENAKCENDSKLLMVVKPDSMEISADTDVNDTKEESPDDIKSEQLVSDTDEAGVNEKFKVLFKDEDAKIKIEHNAERDDTVSNTSHDITLKFEVSDKKEDLINEVKNESSKNGTSFEKSAEDAPDNKQCPLSDDSTKIKTEVIDSDIKQEMEYSDQKPDTKLDVIEGGEIGNDTTGNVDKIKAENNGKPEKVELENVSEDTAVISEVKTEDQESEEEEEEKSPDPSHFELIAESVEELRRLVSQFAEPEPIVIRKGKKEQITYPPPRKRNVVVLHERLEYLLKELEPWESKLLQANRRARIRIRKEKEDYVEPPPDQDDQWNSTDEETESGTSESENKGENSGESKEDKALKANQNKVAKVAETPPIPAMVPELDEIDVSQRGRLRKRRIIPNNVEDQLAAKKPKPSIKVETSDTTKNPTTQPNTNQPIIIQSGKPQMVDYSDIIRQLRSVNTGGAQMPILIRTTQGGRTVLTSVLPITSTVTSVASLNPQVVSASQSRNHPTIQNLLTGSQQSTGFNIIKSASTVQILPQLNNKDMTPTKLAVQPAAGSSKPVMPIRIQLAPNQASSQNPDAQTVCSTSPKLTTSLSTIPKKIAPHTQTSLGSIGSVGKVKYYPANASTLPINVVQQLLATRGAKLQTGPNQQSILYIPMETEGGVKGAAGPVKHQFLSPVKKKPETLCLETNTSLSHQLASAAGVTMVTAQNTSSVTVAAVSSSGPMLILPKSQIIMAKTTTVNVSPSAIGPHMIQGVIPSVSSHSATVIAPGKDGVVTIKPLLHGQPQARLGMDFTKTYHTLPPTSPPRYPTNETVRTLLDKKKSGDEKVGPLLKQATPSTYPCIVSQLQGNAPKPLPANVPLKAAVKQKLEISSDSSDKSTTLCISAQNESMGQDYSQISPMSYESVNEDGRAGHGKVSIAPRCVITSISAAKLNTLLLQTTAAGAKSIPSLIKLPSKAVLDSAVKAVVTSVNTTLPTVNIKVPSPTTLPSIGPRRNVTKTIQTMKSPIPVAPKVITQSSGSTTLSVANSNSVSQTHPVSASGSSLTLPGTSPIISAINNSVGSTTSVQSSMQKNQLTAVLQDTDGKKILTKVSPQTFLTSNGLVQVGYMTPQGMIIPKLPQQNARNQTATIGAVKQEAGSSSLQGVQLVQNSSGQLQLIQRTSPVLQQHTGIKTNLVPIGAVSQASNATSLQAIRPMVAYNSSGNPVIVTQSSAVAKPVQQMGTSLTQSTSPPTAILPKTTSAGNNVTPIKSQIVTGSRAITPQPSKSPVMGRSLKSPVNAANELQNISKPPQSPILIAKPSQSPVFNMQPSFIIPNAANPHIPNQLGVNLLQSGGVAMQTAFVPSTQNVNILQPSTTSQSTIQLFLNQSNSSTVMGNKLVQQSLSATQLSISAAKTVPTLSPPVASLGHILATPTETPGSANKITFQKSSSTTSQAISTPVLSHPKGLLVQNVVKNLNTTFVNASDVDARKTGQMLSQSAPTPVATMTQKPSSEATLNKLITQSAQQTQQHIINSAGAANQVVLTKAPEIGGGAKATLHQQKLLLFSIGGQLVTGQGVPVTLSDGVLKLMPQAKVQIANQTLSPEQIQQTLSKINHAATSSLTVPQQGGPSNVIAASVQLPQNSTQSVQSVRGSVTALQHAAKPQPGMASSGTPMIGGNQESGHQAYRNMDHSYQHRVQKVLTVPKTLSTSIAPGSVSLGLASLTANIQSGTGNVLTNANIVGNQEGKSMSQLHGQFKANVVGLSSAAINEKNGSASINFRTKGINSSVVSHKVHTHGNKSDKTMSVDNNRFVLNSNMMKGGLLNGNENTSQNLPNLKELSGEVRVSKGSNSHLVLDEKEAALNLLTLANQGLEPMMLSENKVDNSGDS